MVPILSSLLYSLSVGQKTLVVLLQCPTHSLRCDAFYTAVFREKTVTISTKSALEMVHKLIILSSKFDTSSVINMYRIIMYI